MSKTQPVKSKQEKKADLPRKIVTANVAISTLKLDPENVHVHNVRSIAAIKASLGRFGQQKPIVVDSDNVVRAGNGTLQAAIELGWKRIEIVRTELTGDDLVAYAIADNRTAELASWDEKQLLKNLTGIRGNDDSLIEAAGFNADELAEFSRRVQKSDRAGAGGDGVEQHLAAVPGVKNIILYFDELVYNQVVSALADVCSKNGLKSNAAAIDYLVSHGVGNG